MVSQEANKLAQKYGYLPITIERFIQLFGLDETEEMLIAYEKKPPTSIRVNTLKITRETLKEKLEKKGFKVKKLDWFSDGFLIENEPFPIGATTEYLTGYYFLQSVASWLPVLILNPQPNEIILDLAAAPGGKATHIAQRMNNKGTLFCIDISRERIKSLRSNLARCAVINNIIIRMDGKDFPNLNLKMDKILLDAPCSGEGLMALDRTRRIERTIEDIERMAELQKELFEAAVKSLKKKGELVYSTCSTAPEENEEIITWAMNNFPLTILEPGFNQFKGGLEEGFGKIFHKDLKKARRLFPQTDNTEGFFVCKLRLEEDV